MSAYDNCDTISSDPTKCDVCNLGYVLWDFDDGSTICEIQSGCEEFRRSANNYPDILCHEC